MKRLNLMLMVLLLASMACQTEKKAETPEVVSDFSGTLTEAEIAGGKMTPEILWKFGRLGGASVSPDGQSVLYSVTRYDAKTAKSMTNLFTIPVTGGEPKQLTDNSSKNFAAVWTPCGRIAFMSTRNGAPQVFTMLADGSDVKQLTDVADGVSAFKISPDAKQLMYTADVKLEQSVVEKHPDLPLANARTADDLMYRHWNDWSDYKFSHIFIASLEQLPVKQGKDIMEGEKFDAPMSPYFDDSEITWAPDSKKLAYTCKKLYGREAAVSTNSDIYIFDLEKGETSNISKENFGYDKNPVFSTSGNKIAWMSMKKPGYESDKERLIVMDFATGNKEIINENWDQNAHQYVWSADDQFIYFISGINATHQAYKVNIATREFTQITKGAHDYTAFALAGDKLVGTKMKHSMASEIFVVNEASGEETQLTFINKNIYDHIKMGHSEERWVTTTDGKKMLVWVIFPPNFDANKKYPALLYCQGGPQSTVSQFFSYRWNFQMMAANDYIVVAPNRRGVPSFGEEWNLQISGDYSGQNIKDYLSAIDDVAKESYVDKNHLGAVGASYGAYSVFYLAGHHQGRFKAFIAHCGMYNFESFYGATEETFFPNNDLGGPYWDKNNAIAQKSFANSPHKFVQNWDTPILVIHGGKDFRIPYTEGLQAFNAAQLRGIPSKLLYFPEETHFVLHPQNSILWQREFFSWLDQWLK